MYAGIEAVAFDIDGTLYPSWKLFLRMTCYFFRHIMFFYYFGRTRGIIHKSPPLTDFYGEQARIFAGLRRIDVASAKEQIERIIYKGLERFFVKIQPFPHVYDCIKAMKTAGLKIGILSDFPPEQKGDVWKCRELCDVCFSSEETGTLKPSVHPFMRLAQKLGVPPEKILYVGNNIKYDVLGANNAGMKSACILTHCRRLFGIKVSGADISFKTYRQLEKIVLE